MTEGIVAACPECDHNLDRVRGTIRGRQTDGKRYRCDRCGATFDRPVEREPHHSGDGMPTHGLARKLAQMDPDDLTA